MGHILGSIGAVMIAIIMLPQLIVWWDTGITTRQQRLVADHLQQVVRATGQYVHHHQATLLSGSTVSSGPTVSIETLVSEGFLENGFGSTNAWLQGYGIYVRQPKSGTLHAIVVTTGGRTNESTKFVNSIVPGAAAMAGGTGGYIPSGVVTGQSSDMLIGAGNAWRLNLSSIGIASPGPGHLGAVSAYDASALGQDFLYRIAVPGQPELNEMQTALDMTEHDINNVSSLQFQEKEISTQSCTEEADQGRIFLDKNHGLYLCRNKSLEIIGDSGNSTLMKTAQLARNGDKITKPICAENTDTVPAIFTSPTIFEAGGEAPSMTAVQTWALSLSDTEWQVYARVQTISRTIPGADVNHWVSPGADYHRIMVMTACVKNK